jgi:cytochrome P450
MENPWSVSYSAHVTCSLAHIEMRVLMAKFLYNFTFELADPTYDWASTKRAYGAWNNSGLKMRVKKIVD